MREPKPNAAIPVAIRPDALSGRGGAGPGGGRRDEDLNFGKTGH